MARTRQNANTKTAATKAAKATKKNIKMLSWRADEDIVEVASAISKAMDENKQTTNSQLCRIGIAMFDAVRSIAWMLDEQARETATKGRRSVIRSLYHKGDEDALNWIYDAIYEKLEREGFEVHDDDEAIADIISRRYRVAARKDEEVLIG